MTVQIIPDRSWKEFLKSDPETICSILVAYYHDHNSTHFSTGVKVEKKYIQTTTDDRGKVRINLSQPINRKCPGYTSKNSLILGKKNRLETIISNHYNTGKSLAVADIGEAMTGEKSKDTTKSLLQYWREFLEDIRGTVEASTIRNYVNSCDTFEAFMKSNGWQGLPPNKFTLSHYKRFEGHLRQARETINKQGKVKTLPAYTSNQQAKVKKHFKAALTYITKLRISIGFDIDEVSYKEKPGLKISLTEDELKSFIDAELSPNDDKIRDLFVLQCSLGPRVSDLRRIDQNISGNKIILETQKNEKVIEIPIHPHVRTILKKHNYKLPKISDQKYRLGIKRIYRKLFPENTIQVREGNKFKTVPVWQEISSHDAVRTFITLSNERGMSVNSIAKVTGKTVKVLLENYLVESQKVADKEMEKAWGSAPLRVSKGA